MANPAPLELHENYYEFWNIDYFASRDCLPALCLAPPDLLNGDIFSGSGVTPDGEGAWQVTSTPIFSPLLYAFTGPRVD